MNQPVTMKPVSTGLMALAIMLSVLAVYGQTAGFDWLRYDDPQYVLENPLINQGLTRAGLVEAFTHGLNLLWIPITSISYMVGVSLHGLHPAGHHLTNVILHALNAVLVLLLLKRLTGNVLSAGLAAALFAIHPLGVEPVAWISGRKDLLCAFFWMLALLAHARFAEEPRFSRMLPVLGFFAMGMASKVTMMTLPAVMLVLDWQPLKRISSGRSLPRCLALLVGEKLPLFLIGGLVAWWAVQLHVAEGGIRSLEQVALEVRAQNAIYVYALYLWKLVVPTGLTVHYPYIEQGPGGLVVGICLAALLGISALALFAARRQPLLLVGWLWYLITLMPSVGLVRVDSFLTADRYVYVPMIGIYLMVGVGLAWGASLLPAWRRPVGLLVVGGLLLYAMAAFVQAGAWRNDVALFARAASLYPESPPILNGYGTALNRAGLKDEAKQVFERAREADGPFRILPTMNLAMLHASEGAWDEARRYLDEITEGNPAYLPAYQQLARVLQDQAAESDDTTAKEEALQLARQAAAKAHLLANETESSAFTAQELAQAHRQIGGGFYRLLKVKDAMAHFAAAEKLYPLEAGESRSE